jgi:hypothetical protein
MLPPEATVNERVDGRHSVLGPALTPPAWTVAGHAETAAASTIMPIP